MNFQQLIQQAVERSGGDVQSMQNFDNATRLARFVTDLTLDSGKLMLDNMEGSPRC